MARLSVAQPATPALTVNADGSASTDTDFTPIATYRFSFGDGTPTVTASAPTTTAAHRYASAGNYTVTLVALDSGGNASAPVSKSINVQADAAPIARLSVVQLALPPLTVNADASTSTDGDLTPTATATHIYALTGVYTVTLNATDTGGFASSPAAQIINVGLDAAPIARLSISQPPTPALTVNADGSTSTDGDLTPIATYRFDFGDGTPTVTANAPSATASHVYATAGAYTVTLICTDTGGNPSTPASQSLTVQAENPPLAQLTVTQPPTPALTVNASGSA